MSYTVSTLGMQLPVVGSGQAFETAVVNGDFLILENGILADRARLTSIEGWAVRRAGLNGSAMFLVADVPTLDALTTALVGDQAILANPGTGADPYIVMTAISGTGAATVWRLTGPLMVDTKAHLDAIIAAWAATSLQFEVGQQAFVSGTRQTYIFRSTAGAYLINATPLRMVGPTAGGVTFDPQTGLATSTAQATLAIGSVATPIFVDPFTDYNVSYDLVGNGAATSLTLQFLDAAAAAIAGTLNDVYRLTINNSVTTNAPLMLQSNIPLSGGLGGAGFRHRGRFSIRGARDASAKIFETHELLTAVPGVAATGGQVSLDGVVNSNALLTGFQFVAGAGAFTINELIIEAVPK